MIIFTASAQHAAVNFGQVGKSRWVLWWTGRKRLHLPILRNGGEPQNFLEFSRISRIFWSCWSSHIRFYFSSPHLQPEKRRTLPNMLRLRVAAQLVTGGTQRHPLHQWLSPQYDWCSWIPNAPPTMRAPPPTAKGVVTIEQIIDTLPDRGRSCWHLGAVWALSQFQENEVRGWPSRSFYIKPIL